MMPDKPVKSATPKDDDLGYFEYPKKLRPHNDFPPIKVEDGRVHKTASVLSIVASVAAIITAFVTLFVVLYH
jgi:hypothetical protein